MELDINNLLKNNNNITLAVDKSKYEAITTDIARQLSEKYNKICYISLNQTYNSLKKKMFAEGINFKKFVFIDAITKKGIPNPIENPNCYYVSAPNALTEIGINITKILQTIDPDCILFDNISTLLIYEKPETLKRFIHSLITKANAFGVISVLIMLKSLEDNEIINELNLMTNVLEVQ